MPPSITTVPWAPFSHLGRIYDLTHLHPFEVSFEQPAQGAKPPIVYTVDVTFSLHCFTKSPPKTGGYDRGMIYRSAREDRLFDIGRYEYSLHLPEIIRTLAQRKCMHTGHGNFFTVELVTENGQTVDYEVFFTASKSARKGRVTLFIQSAFVREKKKLPPGKPVRFVVILHNTLHGKPIRD